MTSELIQILRDPDAEPKEFLLIYFEWITKGFLEERLIGGGTFGEVYLGVLRDGSRVAVKKLRLSHSNLEKQIRNFEKEVDCLRKVRHKNVVRFLGYCAGARKVWMRLHGKMREVYIEQRLLCFEYVPNGTLEKHITDELEWQQRYEIIMGICAGVDHIHNEGHILHLDLKPDNILLDNKLVPKIADFGLSFFLGDQSKHTVNTIKGTRGYMARECFTPGGKVSRKTDVYSLGAIILKLITESTEEPVVEDVLSRWAEILRKKQTGYSFELAYEQVKLCIAIALKCLNESPEDRPVLSDIIESLDMLRPPAPRDTLSPMGEACCRMDLTAIHQILLQIHYRDDERMTTTELSFQMWTEQTRKALDIRKRGDFAFRDKDFKGAIGCYTEFVDEGCIVSPTVFVRRSLCHLMRDQPDPVAALQDAMAAQVIYPYCPTASYMHAVALSVLNMHLLQKMLNMHLVKEKLNLQTDAMDLTAIHQILLQIHYGDDEGINELSFQIWTEQAKQALNIRRRGDSAFRDKDFKGAIGFYTEFVDEGSMVSPTVFVRRSLCHLMRDQPDPDAALRDAMAAQALHPDCPTASYMHAVALSVSNMHLVKEKLNMQSDGCDAMDMLNIASQLEGMMQ